MNFYSTKSGKNSANFSFKEAIFMGPAPDGGLFMPTFFPKLGKSFFDSLDHNSIIETGTEIIYPFTDDPISLVHDIVSNAFTFPAPLNHVAENLNILELFHGPTLAFKDFGARFMAQVMANYKDENVEINILVATSGDTGGAVASAFSGLKGFNVFILFPKGKVSLLQQKQLTTWDNNVHAIEVAGTFDDCQRLVKTAFADKTLRDNKIFGSANSINIARLLPQMVYYFEAYRQAKNKSDLRIIVPSGNFGNLTAGLFAKRLGLPISQFIAATNINDIVPSYLKSGVYTPKVSRETLSNAMDVGDPSNFVRIAELYRDKDDSSTWNNIKKDVKEHVVDDKSTMKNIKEVFEKHGYIMDPHTAVAYDASKANPGNNIIVSTAHWSKFEGTIKKALGNIPALPEALINLLNKKERKIPSTVNYDSLLEIIK